MPLYLNEEQLMLRESAQQFVNESAPVSHMRALRDALDTKGFSSELWQQFGTMGFNGILVRETDGGMGLGMVEAGVVLEEIGRNLTPSPFLATSIGAVTALNAGSQSHRTRWFPSFLSGKAVAALAIDEGAKHRPHMIEMSAVRSGNGFRLNGSKRGVALGHVADLLIVVARTAGEAGIKDGLTIFAVEQGSKGLDTTPNRLADSSIVADLNFNDVEVDADTVIGDIDGGWVILSKVLQAMRAASSSEMLGVGAGAMDRTINYLKERKQFGVAIGSFQALQHRAAHLYSEMEVARSATLKAQQLIDSGSPDANRASMVAKAMTGMVCTLAVQEGIQMHGGIGMTDEYDIGFFMKRARVLSEAFGDADYHADQLARLDGY